MKVLKKLANFLSIPAWWSKDKTSLPFSVFDWTISQMAESIESVNNKFPDGIYDRRKLDQQLASVQLMARYWDALAREAGLAGDHPRQLQALTCRHFYCKLIRDLLHLRGKKWPETTKIQNSIRV